MPGIWIASSIPRIDQRSVLEVIRQPLEDGEVTIARTIADFAAAESIQPSHIAEAIQYRTLDRQLCI